MVSNYFRFLMCSFWLKWLIEVKWSEKSIFAWFRPIQKILGCENWYTKRDLKCFIASEASWRKLGGKQTKGVRVIFVIEIVKLFIPCRSFQRRNFYYSVYRSFLCEFICLRLGIYVRFKYFKRFTIVFFFTPFHLFALTILCISWLPLIQF